MALRRILGSLVLAISVAGNVSGKQVQPTPTPSPVPAPQPQPQLPPTLTPADKDAIAKLLNEALVKADEHPFRIVCSATSLACTPPAIFISAAAISAIEIKDIPSTARALTVRLTAGESDANGPLIVERVFDPSAIPDHIIIALNKARRSRTTFEAPKNTDGKSRARNYLESQSNVRLTLPSASSTSKDPAIGFVTLGSAEALLIQLQVDNAPPKTIVANLDYQRWFVDMGGFITFVSAADQELVTEDAGDGQLRVLKKRRKDAIVPGTGIVLNFHPANYPALAAQFGIATSVDRAASYYLGFGYRLRELGPRTLATFAFGIAATQVKRFPDVSAGDVRPATATSITQGSNRYAFGPYLSLSLGFSFGGVDNPQDQPSK